MIERSEKMRDSKRVVLYISIMVLSIFIIGCGKGNEIKEDAKEEQIKKSFAKMLDYRIKISRTYMIKKDIEMANQKGDKGMWTIYTDFAKSNRRGVLDNERMVLNLDRNTRTAKGYYFVEMHI